MSNRIGGMVNNVILGIITGVIFILVGVALGPTVVAAVADVNMTTLADVPLGSVIYLLATYVPAFYYLGVVLGGLAMIWAATRQGRS